jgi:cobalt/nickel transport system permease protein
MSKAGTGEAGGRRNDAMTMLDPRTRIVAAVVFSVFVAAANRFPTLGLALAAGIAAALLAGLSPGELLKRLMPLNVFLLFLVVIVPLTAGGLPLAELGPLSFSRDGFLLAARVALKGNAILAALAGLLGTLDIIAVGHALHHLHVPDKLAHLLLLTARYVDVLRRERRRLVTAMRVRGFRPRMSLHAYRAYGELVGMILVRSLDRADRVLAAMKCRGFRGRFYLLDHFAFSRRDALGAAAAGAVLLLLASVEWLWASG